MCCQQAGYRGGGSDFANEFAFAGLSSPELMRPFYISLIALFGVALPAAQAITPQEAEFFEKNIRPVLSEQCYKCHGPEKQKAALRVDSRAALLKGTDDGPVVVPGKPEDSSFIKSLRHEGDSNMPAKADKLPDTQIAAFTQWVRMGMPWPDDGGPAKPSTQQAAAASLWSLKPVSAPAIPAVKDPGHWAKSPVDQFLLAKLEPKGIAPSPAASKRTLIRRATYDLTGLPPTPAEIDAFEKDSSAGAFAKVVDRLLASPRYGERWGRYWLDVARYADTKGYVFTEERRYPYSYTYRDWVIRSLNEDLPYDQFIVQQLAGDQVATPQDQRPLAALGFLTLGRRFLNSQPDVIDDRIDVVCRGLMALTVTCARCHDHKFDPITQKDYYALYGVFASSVEPASKDLPLLPNGEDAKSQKEYEQKSAELQGKVSAYLETERVYLAYRTLATSGVFAVLPPTIVEKYLDRAGENELRRLRKGVDELNAGPLAPPRAMAMVDAPQPVKPHVFIRGNPGRPGEEVPRRFLAVLSAGNPQPFKNGSGRMELARAIASKDNPLTARVMVNRVWNLHFGAGLVRTPADFGTKGEAPTNPELLDYLATRFVQDGWSIKKLHRLIMLSSAYQQTSDDRPEAARIDPENRLVWRMNRRRLDFEAFRDSLLAAAGPLDPTMFGRPVELTTAPYAKRRAVYGFIDRQNLPGVFRTFDFATPDTTSAQRHVTTVPQQALFMMNSPFVVEEARALVAKPEYQGQQPYEAQIHELYECVFARKAEASEVDAGLRFVTDVITAPPAHEVEAPLWEYGYGHYDEASHRVDFHPLPFFNGTAWQGGAKVPDKTLGFVTINASGGHAGNDSAHCTIRRWVAPADATVSVSGLVKRPSERGDGILVRVVSSRTGELMNVVVPPKGSQEVKVEGIEVKKGDAIDFLVDCRANNDSDSFEWHPLVASQAGEWDSQIQFAGPPAPRAPSLKAWEQYAQVLLETNEFVFID
jgi:mono/diheme cytochrome c family protein